MSPSPVACVRTLVLIVAAITSTACANARACRDFDRDVEVVWSKTRRASLLGARVEAEFGREVVHRIVTGLDAFAREWVDQREQACRECVEEATLTTVGYNRVATCLDVALVRQQTLFEVLKSGRADPLAHADALFEANMDLLHACRRAATDPSYDGEAKKVREALALAEAAATVLDLSTARNHAARAVAKAQGAKLGPALIGEARVVHARLLSNTGDPQAAEREAELAERLVRHAQDNRLVVAALIERSLAARLGNRRSDAIKHAVAAEQLARNALPESEIHATALANFAGHSDDSIAAVTALGEALAIRERVSGRSHLGYADMLRQYGGIVGGLDEMLHRVKPASPQGAELSRLALAPLRTALEILTARLGTEHPELALTKINLSAVLARLGRYDEATRLANEALDTAVAAFGDNHGTTVMLLVNLGSICGAAGDFEASLAHARRAEAAASALGDARLAIRPWLLIANSLDELGRFDEALRSSARAVAALEGQVGVDSFSALDLHGRILMHAERWPDVLPVLSEAARVGEATLGRDHPWIASIHVDIAFAHAQARDFGTAVEHLERALAIQTRVPQPNEALVNTLSNLGWAGLDLCLS